MDLYRKQRRWKQQGLPTTKKQALKWLEQGRIVSKEHLVKNLRLV